MNSQYLKVALRRILKNYRSNLIIFVGLVTGITSCLIIYTKITYELSFDKSHSQNRNIYRIVRVTSGLEYTNGGLEYRTGVHFPFPFEIRKAIPELQNVVAMFYLYDQKIEISGPDSTNKKTFVFNDGIVLTEPSFFKVFDYGKKGPNWLSGEGAQVLDRPFTVVITRETAKKLFLENNPIGQDINMLGKKFTVEGVVEDFPTNSDFPFKIIASLSTFTEKIYPGALADWSSLSDTYQCFVVLNKKSNISSIENKFKELYKPHAEGDMADRRLFKLQHLSDVHKESEYGNYNNRTVSKGLLLAISLVGTFIYLIACFNYSNFFLAESFKQRKQIALKLILGSKSSSVFVQFFTEALVVNFCALFLSLFLAFILVKHFYSFLDIPKNYMPEIGISAFLFTLALLFLGGLLSILFTIFNLNLRSLSALLKRTDSGYFGKEISFGKASVILQFVVAQTVIIGTLILIKQIYFINHEKLGYDTENVIIARLPENPQHSIASLTDELLSVPGIKGISYSSVAPSESQSWTNIGITNKTEKKDIDVEIKSIDPSYFPLYSFVVLAGQNFSPNDTSTTVIVNREFIVEAGFRDPDEAIGLRLSGVGRSGARITGVVENFHSGSFHDKIRPCVFINNPGAFNIVNIKLKSYPTEKSSKGIAAQVSLIDKNWKKVFPDQEFEYSFLNDRIADYYTSEYKALNLFMLFAVITIFLCILGILGLSLSMNEKRTKEIGLRKVNGATVTEVLVLLNKSFIQWVAFAFIFACPIAYYAMHKWLQNFAYKTGLSWWVFVAAGVLACGIALITVSLQSRRAATRNPVEALRYE